MSCYDDLSAGLSDYLSLFKIFIFQRERVLGICFGRQIIAHALGGDVVKSKKGWGIGVHTFDIVKYNKWMLPPLKTNKCSLLFSHQDQITKLPPGGVQIGTNSFCKYQIYSIDEHIFCVQGHPEFTIEYAQDRYLSRIDQIGNDVYEDGMTVNSKKHRSSRFWEWIKLFFSKS